MNQSYSLRSRMLLAACFLLVSFLGLMGVVLDQAFRNSAEEGVSERLLLQIYGLLAVADESDTGVFMPDKLQEPDFNQLGTGLYGFILKQGGEELWRSVSALDLSLASEAKTNLREDVGTGVPNFGRIHTSDGAELFYLGYRILWQGAGKESVPYIFVVLQTMDPYVGEVQGFRNSLWGWLSAVVFALILLQWLVMNWGLAPLKKLAGDLKAIEDGKQDRLEGRYPDELVGITRNLNLLLSSERQQREKYSTTLADLAHSLKTPLAILRNASSFLVDKKQQPDSVEMLSVQTSIDQQVIRMDQIIAYQLEQAVVTTPQINRKAVELKPVIGKIIDAMQKIYQSRGIEFCIEVSDCTFYGDERDIMELVGNVLDNACKYGRNLVKVQIKSKDLSGGLCLEVEDDGPGVLASQRDTILERGARLDMKKGGQGIGLAVVTEIVRRYDGDVNIESSPLGGARVVVTLP